VTSRSNPSLLPYDDYYIITAHILQSFEMNTQISLPKKPFPAFPGFLKALGPGVVWLALAQGSSELIEWPYLVAKYGLAFRTHGL